MITRRQFFTVVAGGLALAGSTGGYAFAVEPRFRLVVTEWDLATAKWTHRRPLQNRRRLPISMPASPGCR